MNALEYSDSAYKNLFGHGIQYAGVIQPQYYNAGGFMGTGWCFGNQACQDQREADISAQMSDAEKTSAFARYLNSLASGKQDSVAKRSDTGLYIIAGLSVASMVILTIYLARRKKK